MKTAIVTTTIFVPKLLDDYAKNIRRYKHDAFFVVIGDKKTPKATKTFCKGIEKKYKVETRYLDIPAQLRYLKRYPELNKHLLYNSIQRRNIGILLAYEMGADSVDSTSIVRNKSWHIIEKFNDRINGNKINLFSEAIK